MKSSADLRLLCHETHHTPGTKVTTPGPRRCPQLATLVTTLSIVVVAVVVGACADQAGPGTGDGEDSLVAPKTDGPDSTTPNTDGQQTPDGVSCDVQPEVCDGIDNNCDGQVDEIACACTNETVCYGGPPTTRNIGACSDGSRTCDSSGEFFAACEGWVGPVEEECNDGIDNDCDGTVDEPTCAESCDPGTMRACYTGPAGTENVGTCAAGTQVCEGDRWGACNGEILPEAEMCAADGEDNDCNGIVDDCGSSLEDRFVVGEEVSARPTDFIMAVDNSGSMDDTVAQVEGNLATLATRLANSGVDYRFVLISERGTDRDEPDVCIPEPLAGPGCGNTSQFLHIDEEVDSHDPLEDILECFVECGRSNENYRNMLRPGALTQVIVVSDDESDLGWVGFSAGMAVLGLTDFVFHGIVGLEDRGCVADRGDTYITGATVTGGELLHICDANWGSVIDLIFDATITRLQSTFSLSQAPQPGTLRVFTVEGGSEVEQVGNWIYDPATVTITFREGETPAAGTTVITRYL